MKIMFILAIFFSLSLSSRVFSGEIPSSQRASKAIASVNVELKQALLAKGLNDGAPIFIRIFKESRSLEVWLEGKDGTFQLFRQYVFVPSQGS
ncbi:MAG: hypothetical protein Q9M28_02060 [Mariprofundaceae bacterium]|nr:hypothetical protein [Mariprofundaceae bacterium]